MDRFIFPEEYFDDEIRSGFYVNGMMKRCWAAQLEVLYEVDKVCCAQGLTWFADCGTLMGAVRHGGYIPWDDDLDICMMRKDYDIFCSIAQSKLPEGYVVADYHETGDNLLLRVNNSHFVSFDSDRLNKYHNMPLSVGIDIFPLDNVPPSADDEKNWGEAAKYAFALSSADDLDKGNRMSRKTRDALDSIQKGLNIKFLPHISAKIQLYDLMVNIFSAYKDSDSTEIVLTPYWLKDGSHRYKAQWFKDIVEIPFETGYIKVPAQYDIILRTEYGDGYMTPVRAGGVHDYPHYEGQENAIREANDGYYPYWYSFPRDEYGKLTHERNGSPRHQMDQYTSLMDKAHGALTQYIAAGDLSAARELTTQCQNLAIGLGTLIEKHCTDGQNVVSILEEYCEDIYRLSEDIANAAIIDTYALKAALKKRLSDVMVGIENDITIRRKVVFLPWKADTWPAMEDAWKKACRKSDTDVYIMPLPYYTKTGDDSFGQLKYDGADFPDDIEITPYDKYDLAANHPDEIFIQNPYDECNYTSSIHPAFYSKNLRHYTDKLTYIPWFINDEPLPSDERSQKSMEHYISVPGVVYADEVIVSNEDIRKAYIDFLTEWAGEDTASFWENKLSVQDRADDAKSSCHEDVSLGMKTLLYHVSISALMEHKEKMLEKMRRTMEIFDDNADSIRIVYYTDDSVDRILPHSMPQLYKKYRSLIDELSAKDYVTIVNDAGADSIALACDAYYGAPGRIAQRFSELHRPVMLHNPDV